jgi:hypothetical protein
MIRLPSLLRLIAVACFFLPAFAFGDEATEGCASDAECPDGYVCLMACPDIACEPDDDHCDASCFGSCEPEDGFASCTDDEDCGAGSHCLVFEYEVCTSEPGCEPGGDCPGGGGGLEDCETHTDSACVPDWFHACESDDDCEDGLACISFEETHCEVTSPPCADPTDGCPPEQEAPGTCETVVTEAYCLPPYLAPCESDADCGDGFECVAEEWCWCEGSDGGGGGEEPSCGCETGDTSWCEIVHQACDEDDDCADGWSCDDDPAAGPDEPTCAVGPDGSTDCDDAPAAGDDEDDGRCVPPYWDDVHFGGGDGGSQEDADPASGDGGEGGDAEDPEDPAAPRGSRIGGCDTSAGGPSLPALGLLLVLGLARFVSRRHLAASWVRRR